MKFPQTLSVGILLLVTALFFSNVFLKGLFPIPSDTIMGLYHPFRDVLAKEYPNGIPFKNFLITDPVRQQYPWRHLSISLLENRQLPLWNPYEMAGTPLLGGIQGAPFYPLNVLFLFFPFPIAWSTLVILQPVLAAFFLYLYLGQLRIKNPARILGSLVFAFCGFSIAWLEWGTIVHVGLWLPLILLSIDKIFLSFRDPKNSKSQLKNKKFISWSLLFIFSLASSFLAGHLQTFFYVIIVSIVYILARWWQYGRDKKILILFIIYHLSFIILTSIQWIPTLQFILHSAREIDQSGWQKEGWFIPWQHALQFFAPDFFGNPTTLNYWGVWNYGEFIGYVGIPSLVLAFFALFFRHDRKTLFFGTLFFVSLIFSFPTIFAKLPFILHVPFLSTAQPTRLLFATDFSLAILSAFGLDYFMDHREKIVHSLSFFFLIFGGLWIFVLWGNQFVSGENLEVTKRNLFFPTSIFVAISSLFLFLRIFRKAKGRVTMMIYIMIVVITVVDLIRFGQKFTPFTNREYLFPQTGAISFLQNQKGNFRIMTTDSRILPPNFSTYYRIQSIDGYNPLYLKRYAEFIAASERGKPSIDPPFGFNRIITPHNYDSKIIDLLGVKYVLSLSDLKSPKLQKVFQEGQTRVYENKNVFPRTFLVDAVIFTNDGKDAIEAIFDEELDLKKYALVERSGYYYRNRDNITWKPTVPLIGKAEIVQYAENNVLIKTESNRDSFLVLTDSYYPAWKAKINNKETEIYRTDYNFRGIYVPNGKSIIEFYIRLF